MPAIFNVTSSVYKHLWVAIHLGSCSKLIYDMVEEELYIGRLKWCICIWLMVWQCSWSCTSVPTQTIVHLHRLHPLVLARGCNAIWSCHNLKQANHRTDSAKHVTDSAKYHITDSEQNMAEQQREWEMANIQKCKKKNRTLSNFVWSLKTNTIQYDVYIFSSTFLICILKYVQSAQVCNWCCITDSLLFKIDGWRGAIFYLVLKGLGRDATCNSVFVI